MRASYTIEGSLLIPLFLLMMAVAMETGITLYQDVADDTEQESSAEIWAVEDFYRFSAVKELKGSQEKSDD